MPMAHTTGLTGKTNLYGRGKMAALADNRVAEVDLQWDTEGLAEMSREDVGGFWFTEEIEKMGLDVPSFSPESEAGQGKLDTNKITKCPSCGHEF